MGSPRKEEKIGKEEEEMGRGVRLTVNIWMGEKITCFFPLPILCALHSLFIAHVIIGQWGKSA